MPIATPEWPARLIVKTVLLGLSEPERHPLLTWIQATYDSRRRTR